MIHFFRRIRQTLVKEGKFRKYLLYAFGEVALVMIGILLALQVNNWNEQRKERREELVLLNNLLDEFRSNQMVFEEINRFKTETKEKWDNFLPIIADDKSSLSERAHKRPNNGAIKFNTSNSVVNSILTSGKLDIISNDSLKQHISSWNDVLNAYREIESRHINLVENNLRQYEIKNRIIEDYDGLGFYFSNPFYTHTSETEHEERMLRINQDPEYQNLLLLNYMWLHLINQRADLLDQGFKKIVDLLENEINTKTK